MTPPAPTQASAAAEKKSIQPSSTHDHGRSNQGDAKEDKMSDDEGARTTATGHVFCKEEVVDGRAANQEQCKQASDSDEPTTQQVQLSQRRTRRRPPVVEDSDDDIVPSARKGDSSDDSDEVSMTKQTTAASSRRPVVARPGFADSDDSDDGLTADSKRTVLAQTHSTHAEKAQDEESLEDFVPAATPSDSDAASPRESLASRPVLQVAPTPSSKAAADGLSDDDVFLDVILDESDVDSNPPARAPPVAPSALPLPDSSDSDSRPDVVAPSPPVVQRPSISTREIPTTPVESTLPPAMPSLTVVNVMSTQPVDDPTSINHPARHAAGGRAKKRGVKARLDLLDSGSEHSSSPTGRKATHDAAKPPAIAASDGERSSGDQEFVVAKSSSFWSDDDDDDDDKFVTSSSMQRGRNSSPPLAPVKPAIAPTPPASATQMNASVLAAIEEAKRAAIEMLQTTATSTPMPAALLVSTATDVNKPKADKTRKKTLSKRSKAKSAARMHVVASDEDS
ncbi:hypothetical protein DYB32_006674 [Aphanomyces invadans]|uniref:Uncharacterized protein n=1 Tax=Aphanomyces invadans TaxID=157072 RepID=A0A3R6ZMR8_9STRA|nr:hypothetical protein DYB32_006674 [Aphanomyces invadans]